MVREQMRQKSNCFLNGCICSPVIGRLVRALIYIYIYIYIYICVYLSLSLSLSLPFCGGTGFSRSDGVMPRWMSKPSLEACLQTLISPAG